jgi:hypothetical protein
MRKYITSKFIFVLVSRVLFSSTKYSFKYYSICTTILHGFTLLSNFMSLCSTQRKMLEWEQILCVGRFFVSDEDVNYTR